VEDTVTVRYFQRILADGSPVALFRHSTDERAKTLTEARWDSNAGWDPTDRLTEYLVDGYALIEEVGERDAMRAFPDAFESRIAKVMEPTVTVKHLAGKHDQKTHAGHGHGGDLAQIASKIKEKTSALEAGGGAIISATEEDIVMAQENLEMIADLNGTSIDDDSGLQMTRNALDAEQTSDNVEHETLIAVEGETGSVAGAIRVEHVPAFAIDENKAETADEPEDAVVEVPRVTTIAYLGTTGMTDGAGSALFGSAVKIAAKRKEGLILEPLDAQAESYWRAMGFVDKIKIGSANIVLEDGLILSAEAVADLAKALS